MDGRDFGLEVSGIVPATRFVSGGSLIVESTRVEKVYRRNAEQVIKLNGEA